MLTVFVRRLAQSRFMTTRKEGDYCMHVILYVGTADEQLVRKVIYILISPFPDNALR